MSTGTPGRLDKILAHATLAGRPSGSVLRLERLALRIDQKAFAKALGMSRQRLDVMEKRESVTDEFIERMLEEIPRRLPNATSGSEGETFSRRCAYRRMMREMILERLTSLEVR